MAQAPATPGPQTLISDAPTGTWTHPRLPEIQARLNATIFGERQIRIITSNVILMALTLAIPALISLRWLHLLKTFVDTIEPGFQVVTWAARIFAFLNITLACAPLVRKKDDMSDIPLTPTQRALLGLEPTNKPATPGSHYITPPRYSRTPTPRGGSRSGSPYSDPSLSSTWGGTYANSHSPSASPLFQKAVGRDAAARRLSQGSPVPSKGRLADQSITSLFSATPSPSQGRSTNMALSSRWLFEKSKQNGLSFRGSYS